MGGWALTARSGHQEQGTFGLFVPSARQLCPTSRCKARFVLRIKLAATSCTQHTHPTCITPQKTLVMCLQRRCVRPHDHLRGPRDPRHQCRPLQQQHQPGPGHTRPGPACLPHALVPLERGPIHECVQPPQCRGGPAVGQRHEKWRSAAASMLQQAKALWCAVVAGQGMLALDWQCTVHDGCWVCCHVSSSCSQMATW